jgi:organic radical activating enzyme
MYIVSGIGCQSIKCKCGWHIMEYSIKQINTSTTGDIVHFSDTIYMQGCMDNCSFCFNKELIPFKSANMSIPTILAQLKNEWVVLTGGEPFFQFTYPLIEALKKAGHKVCVFTSLINIYENKKLFMLPDHIHFDLKMHRDYSQYGVQSLPKCKYSFGTVGEMAEYVKLYNLIKQFHITEMYIKGDVDNVKREELLTLPIKLLDGPIDVERSSIH